MRPVLGERENGTARLEEAVIAFCAALEERPRERMPHDWAVMKANLGNALRVIGEREGGTLRLEEAIAAYRAALEEQTHDRVPLAWANINYKLGLTLQMVGERVPNVERLEQARDAFNASLEVCNEMSAAEDLAELQSRLRQLNSRITAQKHE